MLSFTFLLTLDIASQICFGHESMTVPVGLDCFLFIFVKSVRQVSVLGLMASQCSASIQVVHFTLKAIGPSYLFYL